MTENIRTVGSGERVVLCLPGWFGSSTGWGWLPGHYATAETPVALVTAIEDFLARHP